MAPKRKLLNQAELARELGVQESTVSRWRRKPGFPIRKDGKMNIDQVRRWRAKLEEVRGKAHGDALEPAEGTKTTTKVSSSIREEQAKVTLRYRKAKAIKEEFTLELLRGKYVEVDELDDLLVARALEFRRGLQQIENSIPEDFPDVAGRLKKRLRQEFKRLLERYSRPDPLINREVEEKPKKRSVRKMA